ncbi:MAG TPA: DUF1365 domain-containing protein, partial [Gammaproteobacteria bacterium]|nr:DUF1365 domain-containing protein [Gammaproteobacteria bacterium]
VAARTGRWPSGPIHLLTQLRQFGFYFNPVSFYYCFDREDQLETIVAEVSNTPWGERHCYVLHEPMERETALRRFAPAKELHVSPFMPMDVEYDWRFSTPGERLTVHMENTRAGEKIFHATLALERTPIATSSLARVLLTYPFMTGLTIAGIYWQAFRLWLKRVPVYDHPARTATATTNETYKAATTPDTR